MIKCTSHCSLNNKTCESRLICLVISIYYVSKILLFITFNHLYQVSYGSELSNRGPTFDMDISDFMDGEEPMAYEKAKVYFAQDPSQKCAKFFCVCFV